MGLLDDAIREHLELKRLRGADPSEVARAEREALGPARRAVEPSQESHPDAAQPLAPEQDHDLDEAGDHYTADEFEDAYIDPPERDLPPPADAAHGDFAAPPAAHEHAEPIDEHEDDWPAADEPLPDRPAPPPQVDEHATQVYHAPSEEPHLNEEPSSRSGGEGDEASTLHPETGAEHEPPAPAPRPPAQPPPPPPGHDEPQSATGGHAEGEPGEDVLEETPEFLQETPEHDRLWFEQRPPRDFDFDK